MANFTIYRDSWRRGCLEQEEGTHGLTALFNPRREMMCCLGQVLYQSGVPLIALNKVPSPSDLNQDYQPIAKACGLINEKSLDSFTTLQAMNANDTDQIWEDSKRELKINKIFKKAGHTVEFVDGTAPWFEPELGIL